MVSLVSMLHCSDYAVFTSPGQVVRWKPDYCRKSDPYLLSWRFLNNFISDSSCSIGSEYVAVSGQTLGPFHPPLDRIAKRIQSGQNRGGHACCLSLANHFTQQILMLEEITLSRCLCQSFCRDLSLKGVI